ncbi:MAG: DHHA2 domain-containing protein [Candidatus Aenigmatarchaeota archaeon]
MKRIIITSYDTMDLDGSSCVFAYAELLRKQGKDATAAIFETLKKEAEFVFRKFNIPPLEDANKIVKDSDVILVDASDLKISSKIKPEQVVEIIDHRKIHEAHKFPNAKVQIELVGAAATMVAEKFYNSKFEPSKESAILLYSAIVSNTINFQANVTSERDRKMADWLKSRVSLPKDYTHELFAAKSEFDKPLKEIFMEYFSSPVFGKMKFGIVQLEIVDVEEFVSENMKQIEETLSEIKEEQKVDKTFLTCIDVEKGFNIFVAFDADVRKIIEEVLEVKFAGNAAKRNGIIMRKEIVPLLKEHI